MEIYVTQTVNVSKTPFCKNCLRLERFDRKDASGRCVPYCSLFNRRIELHDGNYLKCNECYPLNDYKRALINQLRKADKEHKKVIRAMK